MSRIRERVKTVNGNMQRNENKDFDPEDDMLMKAQDDNDDDDVEEEEESEDVNAGREHYQSVEESKLRKPEKVKLDEKKYGGQAVSRKNLFQDDDFDMFAAGEEEEDEDPFAVKAKHPSGAEDGSDEDEDILLQGDIEGDAVGEDEEIDSDEAFADGEEDELKSKGFVFRGSGQGLASLSIIDDEDEDESGGLRDPELSQEEVMSDKGDSNESNGSEISGSDTEDSEKYEEDDESEDEASARPRSAAFIASGSSDREKLKELIANDTAALASSLSASLSADAKKGTAVKTQYQTFDRLLDTRIKLQKGLTASNELGTNTTTSHTEAQSALQKAEEAALALFSTIESIRHTIVDAKADRETESKQSQSDKPNPKKRKRPCPPPANPDDTSVDLWTRLSHLETTSLPDRRQILDKWSTKTTTATSTSSSASRLNGPNSTAPPRLTSVLDNYLTNATNKLLPPPSSSTSANSHPDTALNNPPTEPRSGHTPYDDSTFYQSLLRDLVASRSRSTNSNTNPNSTSTLPLLPTKLHPSGNANKRPQQKFVDTKASKGRKVRYTVHEKLENFMAGEGGVRGNGAGNGVGVGGDGDGYASHHGGGGRAGQWNDAAIREFFASLLGQRGMLVENEDGRGDEEMDVDGADGGYGHEMEALRLFRS